MTTQDTTAEILNTVEFDDDGFLVDATAWTPELAVEIAAVLEIELNDRHWVVINFARSFHSENGDAPTMRQIATNTDITMKEIYQLFQGGPAKLAAKVSGLKKPTGCI